MAQIFQINGANLGHITQADWEPSADKPGLDGNTPLRRWTRHVWRNNEAMPAAEWNTLKALEGQKVSITTTNYLDRNGNYITYYGVDCEQVNGRHDGPLLASVVCEFLVRL